MLRTAGNLASDPALLLLLHSLSQGEQPQDQPDGWPGIRDSTPRVTCVESRGQGKAVWGVGTNPSSPQHADERQASPDPLQEGRGWGRAWTIVLLSHCSALGREW